MCMLRFCAVMGGHCFFRWPGWSWWPYSGELRDGAIALVLCNNRLVALPGLNEWHLSGSYFEGLDLEWSILKRSLGYVLVRFWDLWVSRFHVRAKQSSWWLHGSRNGYLVCFIDVLFSWPRWWVSTAFDLLGSTINAVQSNGDLPGFSCDQWLVFQDTEKGKGKSKL